MAAPITPIRPTTRRPSRTPSAPRPPVAATCGMCNGQGGSWETSDGQSPGKAIQRWVPCPGCNGKGTV